MAFPNPIKEMMAFSIAKKNLYRRYNKCLKEYGNIQGPSINDFAFDGFRGGSSKCYLVITVFIMYLVQICNMGRKGLKNRYILYFRDRLYD